MTCILSRRNYNTQICSLSRCLPTYCAPEITINKMQFTQLLSLEQISIQEATYLYYDQTNNLVLRLGAIGVNCQSKWRRVIANMALHHPAASLENLYQLYPIKKIWYFLNRVIGVYCAARYFAAHDIKPLELPLVIIYRIKIVHEVAY